MEGVARLWSFSHPAINIVAPVLNERYNMAAKPYMRAFKASQVRSSGIVRVGILSYQLYDSPVGHLLR